MEVRDDCGTRGSDGRLHAGDPLRPRPFATLAVWHAIAPFVRRDTGEIVCSQRRWPRRPRSRRATCLGPWNAWSKSGALERLERGQYRIHPLLMWKGELAKRAAAEKLAPPLRIVEPA